MGATEGTLVSVVIPAYNRSDAVQRAVQSVAEQTYEPLELLVIDDCSDVPVADELDDGDADRFERFEVVRHDENRGGSAARNTGIRQASGEYVALLDDDDWWEPEKIAKQIERFREGDVGLVFTEGYLVDDEETVVTTEDEPVTVPRGESLTKRLLCRNFVGSCSGVVVDADVVRRAGTFDERFPSWQDQEWYVRLSLECEFGFVPKPLWTYNDASQHKLTDDVETLKNETYPLFLETFGDLAASYGPVFERKMRAWAAYRVGQELVIAGEIREGRSFLLRAVALYPPEPQFYKYLLPALGGRPTYQVARQVRRAIDQRS